MSAVVPQHSAPQQFASDNYAGICPEAWAAMAEANRVMSRLWRRPYTERAADAFRTLFQTKCEVFFAFNGTAANSLALAALCQSYHSVICSASAHVETDECGAPEFFSNGSKLLVAQTEDGKLTPEAVRALATGRSDIHFPKPRAVTITQPTETGRSIRFPKSTPCRRCVASWACGCTWTGRASPMPARRWAARLPT